MPINVQNYIRVFTLSASSLKSSLKMREQVKFFLNFYIFLADNDEDEKTKRFKNGMKKKI